MIPAKDNLNLNNLRPERQRTEEVICGKNRLPANQTDASVKTRPIRNIRGKKNKLCASAPLREKPQERFIPNSVRIYFVSSLRSCLIRDKPHSPRLELSN